MSSLNRPPMLYSAGRVGLAWAGWHFLPNMLLGQLLPIFHKVYQTVLRRQPPAPGTPEYFKHRRWAHAFIMFSYALYTFWDASRAIGPNYYEMLGVMPTADESDLKSGFRNFAKRYHPDRAGPQSEALFMHVRKAYEALKNPTTRFAYDRFGADALTWRQTTVNEYVQHGLWKIGANYVVSICALLLWNKISPRSLAFWNYILLSAVFAIELSFVLSPSPSPPSETSLSSVMFPHPAADSQSSLFSLIWPQRVAYQHIILLKSLSLLLSSALNQIISSMFPSTHATLDDASMTKYLTMVQNMAVKTDQEVLHTLHTSLHSIHGASTAEFTNITPLALTELPDPVKARLQQEIQDMVLESVLLSEGPLRSACEGAVNRKKKSHGKKGQVDVTAVLNSNPGGGADMLAGFWEASGQPPLVLRGNASGSSGGMRPVIGRVRSMSF